MNLRKSNIAKLPQHTFDVLIVGGGINGAVSAAALSAKGARVRSLIKGTLLALPAQIHPI